MEAQPPCLRILESHPEMIQQVSACQGENAYFFSCFLCWTHDADHGIFALYL